MRRDPFDLKWQTRAESEVGMTDATLAIADYFLLNKIKITRRFRKVVEHHLVFAKEDVCRWRFPAKRKRALATFTCRLRATEKAKP